MGFFKIAHYRASLIGIIFFLYLFFKYSYFFFLSILHVHVFKTVVWNAQYYNLLVLFRLNEEECTFNHSCKERIFYFCLLKELGNFQTNKQTILTNECIINIWLNHFSVYSVDPPPPVFSLCPRTTRANSKRGVYLLCTVFYLGMVKIIIVLFDIE